jgi:hypothetical protein
VAETVDRDRALLMAHAIYPEATVQQLEELLWAYTSYPFGDFDQWEIQLVNRKLADRTVFPDQ